VENVEIRLHDTILYNSIYRADDEYLINTHMYGTRAGNAPVLHLTARPTSGTPTSSTESREVRWVPRNEVLSLPMATSMRLRIEHYLSGTGLPHIG
jgi:hypothetical protein